MGAPLRRGLPRAVDAGLAFLGLAITSPLFALLALLVRLSSPGPALFRQTRSGRGGCPFVLLKLRTMRVNTSGAEITRRGDARITPLGRFLRRFKLDELPQLWNVVRGDMALVGPRPEVPRYVDLEDPRWRAALAVRPGLTDTVTLRLRDEEALLARAGSDPEVFYRQHLLPFKLRGAVAYERERSPGRDLAILVRTLLAIVVPNGEGPLTVDDILAAPPASIDP